MEEGNGETGNAGRGRGSDRTRVLRVAALVLLAAAAALVYLRKPGEAFIVAVLAASAWFLNVRAGLIRKHDLVKVSGRNWRPRREVEAEAGEEEWPSEDVGER